MFIGIKPCPYDNNKTKTMKNNTELGLILNQFATKKYDFVNILKFINSTSQILILERRKVVSL